MLSGALYDAGDADLTAGRERALRLVTLFNSADEAEGRTILLKLLGALGEGSVIRPNLRCDYGTHITIGSGSFINWDCVLQDVNRIAIGDHTQLGPGVHVYTAMHPLDPVERRSGLESGHAVVIGNDVWIGGGAIICSGVTIGDGTTIGAGSVVLRDVPPRVLAAGNPCRVVRAL